MARWAIWLLWLFLPAAAFAQQGTGPLVTSPTLSQFGQAFPNSGLAIGVKNGLNIVNLTADGSNNLNVNCQSGCSSSSGSTSNASDAVATSSTNGATVAWLYGFNGTTWDRLRVDASKFLNVNCQVGCSGGSASNASDAVATSSTNGTQNAWNYGFNGTTWDRLRVDGSKNLNVNINAAIAAGSNVIGGVTQSGTWAQNITQIGGSAVGTGHGTASGALRVELPTDGTGQIILGTGSNSVGAVTQGGTWNVGLSTGSNTVGKVDLLGNAGATLDFVGQNATAPANGLLVGCIFNQTQPAITSTNVTPLNCDNVGNLRATLTSGLPGGGNTIGKIDILGNAGAIMDFAGQNVAQPANALLVGGEFNSTPTTVTNGNASPLQIDSSANLLVNVKTALPAGANIIGAVTQSGTWNVGLSSGSNTVGKVDILGNAGAAVDFAGQNAASPNALLIGCQFNTSPTGLSNGNATPEQCDTSGNHLVKINVPLPNGSNTIGSVNQAGTWAVTQSVGTNLHIVCDSGCAASSINNVTASQSDARQLQATVVGAGPGGAVTVQGAPLAPPVNINIAQVGGVTSQGFVPTTEAPGRNFSSIIGSSVGPTVVESGPGSVLDVNGFSISSATPVWLKLYDSANVTCGSGTPVARYLIPAAGGTLGSGFIAGSSRGFATAKGLSFCVTGGIADADTTAPAASSYVVNIVYR